MFNQLVCFILSLTICVALSACGAAPSLPKIQLSPQIQTFEKSLSCFKYAETYQNFAYSFAANQKLKQVNIDIDSQPNLSAQENSYFKYVASKVYSEKPKNYLDYAISKYSACKNKPNLETVEKNALRQCFNYVSIAHAAKGLKRKGVERREAQNTLEGLVYGKQNIELRRKIGLGSDLAPIVRKAYDEQLQFSLYTNRLFRSCLNSKNVTRVIGGVFKVHSGDHLTIKLKSSGKLLEVYLKGFRAPKPSEPGFEASKKALIKQIKDKDMSIRYFEHQDGYNVGTLSVVGRDPVNEMLKLGHGTLTKRDFGPGSALQQTSLSLASMLGRIKHKKNKTNNDIPVLWNGVRYGVNSKQVLAQVKGSQKSIDIDDLATGAKGEISLESTKLFGQTANARFYFKGDSLSQIIYRVEYPQNSQSHDQSFNQVISSFEKKYGRDDFSGNSSSNQLNTSVRVWTIGSTDISVVATSTHDKSFLINVVFQKHDKQRLKMLKNTYGGF